MQTIVRRILPILLLYLTSLAAQGGDDASGPIRYSVDLSQNFSVYVMSEHDKEWSRSLVKALKYTGPLVHFVRTSLPLTADDHVIQGAIYQAIEKPEYFYVVNGDAMLRLGGKWPYNPGVAGFSMHAPKSRRFIVCLNLDGGVPFLSGSPVEKHRVDWKGHDYDRFK